MFEMALKVVYGGVPGVIHVINSSRLPPSPPPLYLHPHQREHNRSSDLRDEDDFLSGANSAASRPSAVGREVAPGQGRPGAEKKEKEEKSFSTPREKVNPVIALVSLQKENLVTRTPGKIT